MGLNLIEVLRTLDMYPDHWHSWEEPFFHHTRVERESRLIEREDFHEVPIEPLSWKKWLSQSRSPADLKKVIFVDGVRRIHRRLYGGDGAEGCVAEIIVGHLLWDKNGSIVPCRSPRVVRIVALPEHKIRRLRERSAYIPLLESFNFELVPLSPQGEDRVSRTVNNHLLLEESNYLRFLVGHKEGFVVKDGTIHPGAPLFSGIRFGPVGLVKRVLREHLPLDTLAILKELGKGERTPFYAVYLREREDILRIMCYLRISEPEPYSNPMKGIVRLEVIVGRMAFEEDYSRERLKREISVVFDSLAIFLSSLTIKGCDLPRSPENLPVIASLEEWLSSFFLPSDYISALLEGGISP